MRAGGMTRLAAQIDPSERPNVADVRARAATLECCPLVASREAPQPAWCRERTGRKRLRRLPVIAVPAMPR